MNTISVIVPCYNVAPYLERCIDSIVNQTYQNLDIILVNDGSTDDTGNMCDRLAQTDNRIRVVHKKNGGLSDARNAGIDVAKGDFLSFVDGDDYLELDAYEAMILEMQNSEVSLVSAGIIGEDIAGRKSSLMSNERLCLSKEEALLNLLGTVRTIGQSSCNKLFRKKLFENLRYKKGIINEDMEILPKILDVCNYVVLLNKPIYHYVKRVGSITELEFSLWRYQSIRIAHDTLLFCKKKYPQLVPYAYYYEMDSLFKMYEELVGSSNRKEFCKQEYVLRLKIVKAYLNCIRWKVIKEKCGVKIKNMVITAFFGVELTKKLLILNRELKGERISKKMLNKVCLLIIYNHRYDANIEKLEKIYDSRFANIYHIVPFYTGMKQNVIPVYECSFRFEGYVAQAMKQISEKFEYYFFVADDIVMNPNIDETNYKEWFGLKDRNAFITFTKPISEMKDWALRGAFMDPLPKFERYNGTIWKEEIMSAEQAFDIAQKKGIGKEKFCVDLGMVWKARKNIKKYPRLFVLFFKILMLGKQYCPYPVWGGYSDIFIVSGEKMNELAHMLGVLAAMNLFVEMAIPTAMNLLFEDLVEEKELETKAKVLWSNEDRDGIENKYNRDYKKLTEEWENDCLYIHPVKLSRWEV